MAYSLATSYAGDALINGFNWIDTRDLSNGYVQYQSQANAASQGLFAVDKHTGVVRIGVDHTNTFDVSDGRPSIRLESKEAYNQGLFVADFLHMPPSQCGVWPAFWAYGPNWPNSGEIDIIEGANTAHRNIISAHTTAGCSLGDDVLRMASGAAQTKDCNVGADNVGCGYVTPASDTSSYGDTFNAVGGGIYAMLWDDEYIKVWHFDRDTAPADIAAKKPEPAGWGKPAAVYGGKSCDVESHFRDMSIVLNINFCGDYGNAVWKSDGCSALAPTCAEWVAKNPAAFANAYWDVNYIDAYVQSASNTSTTSSVSFSNFTSSTVSSQSQPSSIPITSLSSTPPSGSNNDTMTRFPAANSSSSAAPTSLVVSSSVPSVSGPSNSSSFITNISTRFSSSTVLATQGPIPTASLPSPSGPLRANPANLNDFSYLGCFGSSSDFKSFTKVADSPDMNLNKCTVLCNGKKYAGVFETACYCASELDADTRVSTDACDLPCPGDSTQLCGGRVKPRGNSIDGSIGAKANVTLPQTTAFISGVAMPISTGGAGGGAGGRLAGSGDSSSSGAYASGSYSNSTGPEAPNTFSSSVWNIVTGPKVAYASSAPTPTIIDAATTRNKTTLQTLPTGSGSSASNPSVVVVVPSSVNLSPSGSPATNGHGAWINSTSPETPTPASISSQTGTAPVIRTSSRIGTAPVVSISSPSSTAPPVIGTAPTVIGTAPTVIGTAPTVSVVTIPVYPLPKVTNSTLSSSSISSSSISSISSISSSSSRSSGSSSTSPSSPAVSGSAPAPMGNSTLVIRRRYSPVRRSTPKHVRPAHVDRREASDMLLTVYAAIAKEEPPKQPPGMGVNSDLSIQPSSSTDTPAAQQSSGASIPAQQSSGAGIPAQQSSSAGAPAQQSISMGIPAQQSSGVSIPAQQSSGAGIPAQQSSSAGTPAQQSSGGSSPGQQAAGTGVTSIPNIPAQQSNGNAAAIQTPSTVTSTTTTVVTTVTYQTVYPSNPSRIVNKVFVTTIIKAHCGCPETPLPTMTVSMTTTVLSCAACGPGGANYVTVTVPCDETKATPTAVAELPPAPNSNGNVPPANKNLTPPNGDSVPPSSGGNKPPTPGGNKPPTPGGDKPPASNGSVPPGSDGSVPPGSNGSVPPGSNGSVPPGSNGNVPPGSNGSVPPGSNGSVPPGSNGNVPPGSNGSVPPGSNGSVPPASHDSIPPTSGGNVPPSADNYKPPASNGNKTPSANNDKPPISNGNAPPSADNYKPPASNGNKTPSANNDKPPASNGNVPPAPNSGKPPAANSNKTSSSSSSVPPAVSGNKPAAPSSNVPTVAASSTYTEEPLLSFSSTGGVQ
ncbi:Endo-1,3(4)-beta-glucanase [Beauveria bassiana]|nr:Endo-1,3(4)-beta-glucanase [Beauveria bassiana]KAH8718953.1 Endo-1,3(4)-beta-glucanase [Beauveria bassiana]